MSTCSSKSVDLEHVIAADIVADDLKLLVGDARKAWRFQQLASLTLVEFVSIEQTHQRGRIHLLGIQNNEVR